MRKTYAPTKQLIGRFIFSLLPFFGVIAVWQLIVSFGIFEPSLLPAPLQVFRAILEMARSGALVEHSVASLLRVFSGFLLAAICAVPLGIVLGWYKKVGYAFSPLIEMLRTISPLAWIPLAILWLGIGDEPAIFIIFITSFFPILIATMHAGRHIDPILIRVATNFGARDFQLLRSIILPASLPYIMVGLHISLGISWVVVVAAEMVGLRSGLGYLITDARNFLRMDLVIAAMIVIGVIGFILDRIMSFFERRLEKHKVRLEDVWSVEEADTDQFPANV